MNMPVYSRNLRSTITFLICLFVSPAFVSAQELDVDSKPSWKVEIEPVSFLIKGYGLQVMRTFLPNNRLSLGLYSVALDVPDETEAGIFKNVDKDADTRVKFELAVVARYQLSVGKGLTNPYLGFIGGWEAFNVQQKGLPDITMETYLVTPYVGYEIYLLNQKIYLNPQVRSIFYTNPKVTNATRGETLNTLFVLPTFGVGARF